MAHVNKSLPQGSKVRKVKGTATFDEANNGFVFTQYKATGTARYKTLKQTDFGSKLQDVGDSSPIYKVTIPISKDSCDLFADSAEELIKLFKERNDSIYISERVLMEKDGFKMYLTDKGELVVKMTEKLQTGSYYLRRFTNQIIYIMQALTISSKTIQAAEKKYQDSLTNKNQNV